MKFKGDIIITDPCYIGGDLWDRPDVDVFSGAGIRNLGFTSYIWKDTIYGDWSCTTFKLKPKSVLKSVEKINGSDVEEVLGQFCADAGLVGVFLLDEVLKYNPKFDYHINNPWTTTLIKGFDGDVTYLVGKEDDAHIKGVGNINFITSQTGL